jgi:hypothetical protein
MTIDAHAHGRRRLQLVHGTGMAHLATELTCWLQARVKAISEVVEQLVRGVRAGLDVNVDAIKREAATKYSLARAPKLVEIISAVPDDFRDTLLPRCALFAAELQVTTFGWHGVISCLCHQST